MDLSNLISVIKGNAMQASTTRIVMARNKRFASGFPHRLREVAFQEPIIAAVALNAISNRSRKSSVRRLTAS